MYVLDDEGSLGSEEGCRDNGDVLDEICLLLVERSAIWPEDIMEPLIGYGIAFLGPPGIVSLRSSEYETPVDGPYTFILEDGKMSDELRVERSGHILRADDGPIVL